MARKPSRAESGKPTSCFWSQSPTTVTTTTTNTTMRPTPSPSHPPRDLSRHFPLRPNPQGTARLPRKSRMTKTGPGHQGTQCPPRTLGQGDGDSSSPLCPSAAAPANLCPDPDQILQGRTPRITACALFLPVCPPSPTGVLCSLCGARGVEVQAEEGAARAADEACAWPLLG